MAASTMLAALDFGSNAVRMAIARARDGGPPELVESLREPVRLGQDVFSRGTISEANMERAAEACRRFRRLMEGHGVALWRAVGTSALREAWNREIVLDHLAQDGGIEVAVIGGEEEARLVHLAVSRVLDLGARRAMLIDIGGGSVEVTLAEGADLLFTESYDVGTVRLLQRLGDRAGDPARFGQLLRKYVGATRTRLKKAIAGPKIEVCAGTGGNVEELASLARDLLGRERADVLAMSDLEELLRRLLRMTVEERVRDLKLRADRADVIVPAAVALQQFGELAGVAEIQVPRVGLKDGILRELAESLGPSHDAFHRHQVVTSALQVGRKYRFDEEHALAVARFALQLFDETSAVHKLGPDSRLLLEVAALLHDIGEFVNLSDHNKHTLYLIQSTPIVGLSQNQREIVANVARYHRRAFPTEKHEPYRRLSSKDQVRTAKMAALLRLANGLDTSHGARLRGFRTEVRKPRFRMWLEAEGDVMLESWTLERRADLFEQVFGLRFSLQEEERRAPVR